MTAALVILALFTPLAVGGAFYMGTIVGHKLSRGETPAQAPTEAVVAVKEAVSAVVNRGEAAVVTEVDEFQLEQERNRKAIEDAIRLQLSGEA